MGSNCACQFSFGSLVVRNCLKPVRGLELILSVSALQKKINFHSLSDGLSRISNHPCSIALHMACCSNLMKYAAVTLRGLKFIYT